MPGKLYSKREIATIRATAKDGHPARVAATRIGRSPGAVRFLAQRLGIRFHSLGRKHSRSQKLRYSKGAK